MSIYQVWQIYGLHLSDQRSSRNRVWLCFNVFQGLRNLLHDKFRIVPLYEMPTTRCYNGSLRAPRIGQSR